MADVAKCRQIARATLDLPLRGSPPNEAKPFVSELATIAMFMIKANMELSTKTLTKLITGYDNEKLKFINKAGDNDAHVQSSKNVFPLDYFDGIKTKLKEEIKAQHPEQSSGVMELDSEDEEEDKSASKRQRTGSGAKTPKPLPSGMLLAGLAAGSTTTKQTMLADKMTQLMMEFVTLKPVTEDNVKAVVEAMAAVMCKPENLKAVVEMVNQK